MKTALIIIKRPVIVLPLLARLAKECYYAQERDWTCVIDLGEHVFKHQMKMDFLVRKDMCDLPKLAIDLARAEGKCDRVVMANFGDRCCLNYAKDIRTNCVGISQECDHNGELLGKSFVQKESFVCYSCTDKANIELDASMNLFIARPPEHE